MLHTVIIGNTRSLQEQRDTITRSFITYQYTDTNTQFQSHLLSGTKPMLQAHALLGFPTSVLPSFQRRRALHCTETLRGWLLRVTAVEEEWETGHWGERGDANHKMSSWGGSFWGMCSGLENWADCWASCCLCAVVQT